MLLSLRSLTIFKYHLKNWNPEKPVKAITENLKLILFLAEKLPELKYQVLAKSRYFTEVLRIYNNCLKYLFERKQEEIDENCMLSLALSYVSKYAVKFCINNKVNTMSSFGQQYFKQALSFLRHVKVEFVRNPNNCVYLLILTCTVNAMMSKFSPYKSLFVDLNGIQFCLNSLSDSYKNKITILQTIYYDLRILSILENFVDDPYFSQNKMIITGKLIKYLQCNGEQILGSTLTKEGNWVFQFICSIIMKMARSIKGFKKDIYELGVKQLFVSFLNKYPYGTCAKTIFTTLLVLEDINESVEGGKVMDIYKIMSECERLSSILILSKMYDISTKDKNYSAAQDLQEVI
ncbi:uncharacterized protein [Halyomorpha halys]